MGSASESSTATGELIAQGPDTLYSSPDFKLRHPVTGQLVDWSELCFKPADYNLPAGYTPPPGTGPGVFKYSDKLFTEEVFTNIQPSDGFTDDEVVDLREAYLNKPIPVCQVSQQQLQKWGFEGKFAFERFWLVQHSTSL